MQWSLKVWKNSLQKKRKMVYRNIKSDRQKNWKKSPKRWNWSPRIYIKWSSKNLKWRKVDFSHIFVRSPKDAIPLSLDTLVEFFELLEDRKKPVKVKMVKWFFGSIIKIGSIIMRKYCYARNTTCFNFTSVDKSKWRKFQWHFVSHNHSNQQFAIKLHTNVIEFVINIPFGFQPIKFW